MEAKRYAIVTGAASGLGRALSNQLAQRGWHMALADINDAGSRETLDLVRHAGGDGQIEHLDVTQPEAWQAPARNARGSWPALDLLVNNAGVGCAGNVGELPLDDWRWIININLYGAIYGCHTMIEWMKQNPRGAHIVNIASMAAIVSAPGMAPYNVTKAGMLSLSETLSGELKPHNISVTGVCPAFFPTNILENGRFHKPDQRQMANTLMSHSHATADQVAEKILRAVDRKTALRFRARRGRDFLAAQAADAPRCYDSWPTAIARGWPRPSNAPRLVGICAGVGHSGPTARCGGTLSAMSPPSCSSCRLRPTVAGWLRSTPILPAILIDHAHCEKKAAGTAMNLIFAYGSVDAGDLPRAVGDRRRRARSFSARCSTCSSAAASASPRCKPGSYGRQLNDLVRKGEPAPGRRPAAGGQPDRSPQLRAVSPCCAITWPIANWPSSTAACSNPKPGTTAPTCGWPAILPPKPMIRSPAPRAGRGREADRGRGGSPAADAQLAGPCSIKHWVLNWHLAGCHSTPLTFLVGRRGGFVLGGL